MLIALDANVLMDLAAPEELVADALELVRRRIAKPRLVILPTVIQELSFISKWGETDKDIRLARTALQKLIVWGFEPVNFVPFEFGIIEQISLKLRRAGLLPEAEVNDSFILAEAALLGCGLFLSSDAHFTELDFQLLTLELKACDVSVPSIASPREILRKFYR
jgi:predicted nucleic acid-binding protein